MMTTVRSLTSTTILVMSISSVGLAEWQSHTVRQFNGRAGQVRLPARFQIVTESWNRVVACPYIVNMAEKNRLLMLVGCDYPHRAFVLTSDDRGATWTEPRPAREGDDGKPSVGMGTALAYLGKGKLVFYEDSILAAGQPSRWFSTDYGQTWGDAVPARAVIGQKGMAHLGPAARRSGILKPAGSHGWRRRVTRNQELISQAWLRFSTDEGRTWGKSVRVPQWAGANEVYLFRAANGNLVAACRTDVPRRLKGKTLDHYEGLGISISKDDGRTWVHREETLRLRPSSPIFAADAQ